ncbi:MAG: MOSC domain-containing protein [Cyclobacteriaceae bacterium]|nr:MOSC domain-containing protein [Cyclobacteriaceae bacterium]
MTVRKISEIWIYPIKSLGGIQVEKARVFEKGLEYDRRWMLVDNHNRFITQREYPQLACFQVELADGKLTVTHRNSGASISFSSQMQKGEIQKAQVWNDEVDVIEVEKEISAWFSKELQMPCKLVHFPEQNNRMVDPEYARHKEQVSLADGYPLLIIGQASLDDLNNRLPTPVTIKRFRPTLVFTGGEPYEEDQWQDFLIGNNHFRGVKNCSRCVMTTIDPQTGEKGAEPLRTLSTYRQRNNKIYFGQNLLSIKGNQIGVGDVITVEI